MKTSSLLWWIIGAAALIGIGFGLTRLGGPATSSSYPTDRVVSNDHVKGDKSAKVVLIEYSDFQCPACGAYYPLVKQLETAFGDKLAIVYRHFPLKSIHQNAEAAGRAAEAASLQDKFFAMHDQLFEQQDAWSKLSDPTEAFVGYAQTIGLDVAKFRADLATQSVIDAVNAQYQSGTAARVSGTPTFFLNGTQLKNPRSIEEFKKLVDDAFAKAPISSANTNSGDEKVHLHADVKVVVNATAIDFSQTAYQSTEENELNPGIHFHDANGQVVHIHKTGMTMNDLFQSFGMNLDRDCLKLNSGETKCATGANKINMYVNGVLNDQLGSYVPADLDRILVTYGSDNESAIQPQITSVSDLACIYSEKCPERGKPPTENCVGGLGTDC